MGFLNIHILINPVALAVLNEVTAFLRPEQMGMYFGIEFSEKNATMDVAGVVLSSRTAL